MARLLLASRSLLGAFQMHLHAEPVLSCRLGPRRPSHRPAVLEAEVSRWAGSDSSHSPAPPPQRGRPRELSRRAGAPAPGAVPRSPRSFRRGLSLPRRGVEPLGRGYRSSLGSASDVTSDLRVMEASVRSGVCAGSTCPSRLLGCEEEECRRPRGRSTEGPHRLHNS